MLTRTLQVLSLVLLTTSVACSAAPAVTIPSPEFDQPLSKTKGAETAVLAGGCFWGIQAVFEHVKGVTRVTAGYSGGSSGTAQYETVSSGTTGHAESVRIVYDPSQISYGQLLKVYFSVAHDPTQMNRQGPDEGTQYRSTIFYAGDEQKRIAEAYIQQLNKAKVYPRPIVTQVVALKGFYPAENYHQDYAVHHPDDPYIRINDLPKVDHLRETLPELYVSK
jgi:peptide-methionine (S)-S-oxide reductase